jgi:hypothetical protein
MGLGGKELRGKTQSRTKFCVGMAFLYFWIDILPMSVENIGCGIPSGDVYQGGSDELNWGRLPGCYFQRSSIHFLQSAVYWINFIIFDVVSVASPGWNLRSFTRWRRWYHVVAWGMPLACLVATYVLDDTTSSPLAFR